MSSLFQVPCYQGELITFDVVPSKLTFSVNYKSVVLKVRIALNVFPYNIYVVGQNESQVRMKFFCLLTLIIQGS